MNDILTVTAVSSVGVAVENGGPDIIVRWQIMIDAVSPACCWCAAWREGRKPAEV